MPLEPGTRLGPYEILAPLGKGGMGEVYRARDTRLDREVAIKVLPHHLARDPDALARFEREAKAVAALSHPNILAIHDFGQQEGFYYLVTELLEGEPLRVRLEAGPLPWRRAVEVGVAVCDGLSAAHAKGIVHRDLKPENLFLTSDGRLKILDFGLARWKPVSTSTETAAETEPGTILGTVSYMSPEQVKGLNANDPSDIFSLGCVLYEMVSGHKAFERPSGAETMAAILHAEPPELSGSGRRMPPEMDRLMLHCLEKRWEDRFQSARDLAFALKALLADSSSVTRAAAPARPRRAAIDSLAVLPFANASGDPNADYLSDGVTESIINTLSQLPKLRIVPRSLVFRYKGREVDPLAAGRELGVRALLTGRVVLRGEVLNIQAELVDVAEQSQLWGQQYNRRFSDIFTVQEEISGEICEKLRLRLSPEQKRRLARRHTQDTEAYQLYLKGRYYWNRRTPERIQRGIEFFQQAIDKDPAYAPAYAGLADSYASLNMYGVLRPQESYPRVKAAARQALEIDDKLAEAYTPLAYARAFYDWEWAEAEREFFQALELKRSYATAHHWYALTLTAMGRLEEAIAEEHRALEAEPLSLVIAAGLGLTFYYARRYEESVAQSRKTLQMDPNFGVARVYLGLALEQQGKLEEAIPELEKGVALLEGNPTAASGLGHALARAGRKQEARRLLDQMEEQSRRRYVAPVDRTPIYLGLDQVDEAFDWLDQALEDRSMHLSWINVDPRWDRLRPDPRFQRIVSRMGLGR